MLLAFSTVISHLLDANSVKLASVFKKLLLGPKKCGQVNKVENIRNAVVDLKHETRYRVLNLGIKRCCNAVRRLACVCARVCVRPFKHQGVHTMLRRVDCIQ